MSYQSHLNHSRSFYLSECLRKKLHVFAGEVEDQLHGSCLLTPGNRWADLVPQAQTDAWITLRAWLSEGEPVNLLLREPGGENSPGPGSGLLEAPLRSEAAAFCLGGRGDWMVLARHGGDHGHGSGRGPRRGSLHLSGKTDWGYGFPALSCVWSILGVRGAGAVRLSRSSSRENPEWPAGPAVDPVTEQPRILTRRVRGALLSGMDAALREFSRAPRLL